MKIHLQVLIYQENTYQATKKNQFKIITNKKCDFRTNRLCCDFKLASVKDNVSNLKVIGANNCKTSSSSER